MRNTAPKDAAELDALETREWLRVARLCAAARWPARVSRLLQQLSDHARRKGVKQPFTANTPLHQHHHLRGRRTTIPPGSREIERRIKSLVRWNALAMVVKANKADDGIGGHISTYASAATLYEVGFNHFFKGKGDDHERRHSSSSRDTRRRESMPGRLSKAASPQPSSRTSAGAETGWRSSRRTPIPWLMPDFWEFPTVSMALGRSAPSTRRRFMRYLEDSRPQEAVGFESLGVPRRRRDR